MIGLGSDKKMIMFLIAGNLFTEEVDENPVYSEYAVLNIFDATLCFTGQDNLAVVYIQGDFFNWASPENVSRLAPPKFA